MKIFTKYVTLPIEMIVHINSKNDIKKYIIQHNYFDKWFAKKKKDIVKSIKDEVKDTSINCKWKKIKIINVTGIRCIRQPQLKPGCVKEIWKFVVCVLCAIVGEIVGGPIGAALSSTLSFIGERFIEKLLQDWRDEKEKTKTKSINDIDIDLEKK